MALTRTGPVARQPEKVALGLAQIRVGASAANIAYITPKLISSNSIGALGATKFIGSTEFWRLESGFPLLEDLAIPIREKSAMEITFKELTVANLFLARGEDPTLVDEYDTYIGLGGLSAPDYIRMEAVYTFPNRAAQMVVIFPRANVVSDMELDFQAEDSAAPPLNFEAKRADSEVSGGNAVWDDFPLGIIQFLTGSDMV